MTSKSIEDNKVLRTVEGLGYDFREFELAHFISHIARLRQREIVCKGWDLGENLFGVWVLGDARDYIFYHIKTYAVHRTHIILHEIGHMVLGHVPLKIDGLLDALEGVVDRSPGDTPPLLSRNIDKTYIRSNPVEAEAEDFVLMIQNRVILANRFKELVAAPSSIENFRVYVDALGLDE